MKYASRVLLFAAATAGLLGLTPVAAHAQWWRSGPADFEDCAERVEKSSASGDARAEQLGTCEAKFAGRRKQGGGYSDFDFMQNRSFDLVGPNPTTAEQKAIDEQYTVYLDHQRRNIILAAFAQKHREQLLAALAPVEAPTAKPATTPVKDIRPMAVVIPRPRPKAADCSEPFACGWSRLTAGAKDLRKTLFGPPAKTRG